MIPPNLCTRDRSRLGWAKFDEAIVAARTGSRFVSLFRGHDPSGDMPDMATGSLYSRYALSGDNELLRVAVDRNPRLLLLAHVVCMRYRASVLTIFSSGRAVAQIHAAQPEAAGAWKLDADTGAVAFDAVGTIALDIDPVLPAGVRQWSCTSNELYGLRATLLRAAGVDADLPIMGKLQHSWQPKHATGIDGEWGFRPEVTALDLPVYVWSGANLATAAAAGLRATAIGAPALYMDDVADAGLGSGLLAFPTHSIGECVAVVDWRAYAADLADRAKALGFSRLTVCLHHEDLAARGRIEAASVVCTTLGSPCSDDFLVRARTLIRAHEAVTSDRVCTSGLYALLWDRPFFVSGQPIDRQPPAFDPGDVTADSAWVTREFPGIDRADGVVRREFVPRELGGRLDRDPLRHAVWGWLGL